MNEEQKRPIVVAISGGFDPIHIGHVRYMQEAKKLGDVLVVILNNDHWLKLKKGHAFMPQDERKEVIESIACVDRVVLSSHTERTDDYSVCEDLRVLRPDIFANGGDRKPDNDPVPEVAVCDEFGIQMMYNVGAGGKVQSSSWLIEDAAKKLKKKEEEKKISEKKKKILTLCIFYDKENGRILLGMKKRGFGANRWNGFGGKVEGGETILEAAIRECREEAGVEVQEMNDIGVLDFEFFDGSLLEVHLFRVLKFSGEPQESEEMKPQWFSIKDIPYAYMWPDDIYWLPHVLYGKHTQGKFFFGEGDVITDYSLVISSEAERSAVL